jgi:C-terminal processing protease CtpA/Prc
MKQLVLLCLLAMSAIATAQSTAPAPGPATTSQHTLKTAETDADKARADAAKLEEEETKTRAKLDEARARLDKAAREVAELSTQLGRNERREFIFIDGDRGPRRAILGVQIDPQSGKDGARVRNVSPGGPGEEAGLLAGDVIVALDGKPVTGGEDAGRALVDQMSTVKPDQKVKVVVLRAGKKKDVFVVARPMSFAGGNRMFNVQAPEMGNALAGVIAGMPEMHQFRTNWPGEFAGLELASITPKLGAYFGATSGVLVVQAPEDGALKLEDGDVIQTIDGRKPDDGTHALRILRSYQSGEKLNITVLRQRKSLTLPVTMPDRPEFDDHFMGVMPPVPPVPPTPPMPPAPGGAGTLD